MAESEIASGPATAGAPEVGGDETSPIAVAVKAYEEAIGKYGGSPCDRYIFMAVKDFEVQQAIARHVADAEMLIAAYCPGGPGIPEEARVVFEFRCLPPRICLLPALVLVILNAFTGRVIKLIDPYFPGQDAGHRTAVTEAGQQPAQPAVQPLPLAGHHPSLAWYDASAAVHHPSLTAHHAALAAHHPSLAGYHPALAAHHPSLAGLAFAASHQALAWPLSTLTLTPYQPGSGAHHSITGG